ncbi:MAG: hypothetical protein GY777_16185 [Candidatus Brocadiaceae bacterium]|nr:hypothetical protein [Candidatus Brocadiaceae bacterium]
MKKTLFHYLMISLFCFVGYANIGNGGESMQRTDREHLKKMEELAFWFIETGLGQYYERKGKNDYKLRPGDQEWFVNYPDAIWIRDFVKQSGYLHGIPQVEKDRKIAKFMLGYDRYRLMNITECFLRANYKEKIYEYWVIKEWKTNFDYRQSKFIIVKAASLNGKRTILHTSDQFIEKHKIDKGFTVAFSIEDLKTLYGLQAWDFPDNYKNSDLNEFRIILTREKKYEKVPWPPK